MRFTCRIIPGLDTHYPSKAPRRVLDLEEARTGVAIRVNAVLRTVPCFRLPLLDYSDRINSYLAKGNLSLGQYILVLVLEMHKILVISFVFKVPRLSYPCTLGEPSYAPKSFDKF
jgi:hypothetical protein